MGLIASPPERKPSERARSVPDSSSRRQRFNPFSVLKGVFRRVISHACTEVAGEMAFDFSFAIFPAALFTATIIGLLDIAPETVFKSLDMLGVFLHDVFRGIIEDNIRTLVASSSKNWTALLTVGFLGAVWVGSSAISATIKALNRAYGVRETRSFFHRRLLSLGLVFGVGIAMVVSFNMLILGTWIENQILNPLGVTDYLPSVILDLRLPIGFASAVSMTALLYRFAPNCRPKLLGVLPGSALFAVLWFVLTKWFGQYVGKFSYYSMVTGILWVFIVLLLWIYLTAFILLVGGELNAELSRRRSERP